jgi:hypothetical protein
MANRDRAQFSKMRDADEKARLYSLTGGSWNPDSWLENFRCPAMRMLPAT